MSQATRAADAAALLDEVGGMDVLDRALRSRGFALAAHLSDHDRHRLSHELHSSCPKCLEAMGLALSPEDAAPC